MLDFLHKESMLNIWCSPFQDNTAILQLSRVSPVGKYRNYFDFHWNRITLPTQNEDYHIYAIGRNSPSRLNLTNLTETWVNLPQVMEDKNNFAELYLADGRQLCRSMVYVKRDKNLSYLVAVRIQDTLADIDFETVFMKLYRNSYYESVRDDTSEDKVVCVGTEVVKLQDVADMQNTYNTYKQKQHGHVMAYHNGYLVNLFDGTEIKLGDYLEIVYDASIEHIYDFKLEGLEMYTSEMDGKQKYLLHPPKNLETIQYRDDIDFYIVKKTGLDRIRGKYYNRNREMAVRMITHRDWGLLTEQVSAILQSEEEWENLDGLYIRAHVRNSGYDRPLVDEHNRIKELYKLTDEEIVRALIGLDATIDNWKVNHLEQSSYTRIMRSFFSNLTGLEAASAYGYNAMARLVGDTPIKQYNGAYSVPVGLQSNSTVYEYDSNGLLLGWRRHTGGDKYYQFYGPTVMVDIISGAGSEMAGFQTSNENTILETDASYRFYVSSIDVNGVPFNNWVDVTGDSSYYSVSDTGVVTWHIDYLGQVGVVKSDKAFVSYDYGIDDYNHLYRFSLNHSDQDATVLHIPPGRIDIWMNGKALIESIDYNVIYPEVVIHNKEYLDQSKGYQSFTIRATGFCEVDEEDRLYRVLSSQRGFVKHGMLSVNQTYDVREDKVIRVVANGRTFHRDEVEFAENQQGIVTPDLEDGRPYLVQDAVIPVRGIIDYNTYPYRAKSQAVDVAVSDYLSRKFPEEIPDELLSIPSLYHLYSPLMGRLIYDLGADLVLPIDMTSPEAEVARFMEPYLWLLHFDPCRRDDVDFRFLNIHPHPQRVVLSVTKASYLFLQRINTLYLNDRVDLTNFLKIEGDGESIPSIPDIPDIPDPDPSPIPPPIIRTGVSEGELPEVKLLYMELKTVVNPENATASTTAAMNTPDVDFTFTRMPV